MEPLDGFYQNVKRRH